MNTTAERNLAFKSFILERVTAGAGAAKMDLKDCAVQLRAIADFIDKELGSGIAL